MNTEMLKRVIYDQHEIIRNFNIINRNYTFEDSMNYILVGLRRCGKTVLLYKRVLDLISKGVNWNNIIYINFEDDRLSDFKKEDFDDILKVAYQLSSEKSYYFFDEIQNIDGWEHFARRMADAKETVYITGSNAKMLSREMEAVLGGRYISCYITPFNFKECLRFRQINLNDYSLKNDSIIQKELNDYFFYGGLPERLYCVDKRSYIQSVYQKTLLNDIILRNNIRNENAMSMLIKKMAETVKSEMSFSKFNNVLKTIGYSISKDTIIDYISFIKDAYLVFGIKNYYYSFVDKESNPKYYFTDNGILNLFLFDKDSLLLENLVALTLHNHYEDLYYLKGLKKDIDIDFYIPTKESLIQVCYDLNDEVAYKREIDSLLNAHHDKAVNYSYYIISLNDTYDIEKDDITIHILSLKNFLLNHFN